MFPTRWNGSRGQARTETGPKLAKTKINIKISITYSKRKQEDLLAVQKAVKANNEGRAIKNFHADPAVVECSVAV